MGRKIKRRDLFGYATAGAFGLFMAGLAERTSAQSTTPSFYITGDIAQNRLKLISPGDIGFTLGGSEYVLTKDAYGYPQLRLPDGSLFNLIKQNIVTVFQKTGSYYAMDENGIVICRDSRTACIQEAVNHVNSLGGGMVYIRRGTYLMKAPVILDNISNVIIKGDGRDVTVLKPDPNSPAVGFKKDTSTPTYNLVFEDFTIDAGLYDATQYQVFGIYLWINTYDVYIHRLKLINFLNRMPIHTEKVTGWIVGNYIKTTITADAIALAVADGGQAVVADNEIYDNKFGGITTGAYNGYLTIVNNIVDTTEGYACISLETAFGYIRRAVVANNSCIGHPEIYPNSDFSINIGNKSDVALEEAVVVGNILKHGTIYVTGGVRVVVAGNLVIDPVSSIAGIIIDSVPQGYRPTIIVSFQSSF